jgi:hypothetical protein
VSCADIYASTNTPWVTCDVGVSPPPRADRQDAAARRLTGFLSAQSAVEQVQHLSLPTHPSHQLWRESCRGAPPFIRFCLRGGAAVSEEQVSRFLDALRLVQIGGGDAGWGGEVISFSLFLARSLSRARARLSLARSSLRCASISLSRTRSCSRLRWSRGSRAISHFPPPPPTHTHTHTHIQSSKIWPIGAVEAWEAGGIAKRGSSVGEGAKSAAWGDMVLYVGLESPDDVMEDLASALGAL